MPHNFDEQTLRDLVAAHRALPTPPQRRKIREDAGVSLAELADVLGVSSQQMTAMERAARPAHLIAYGKALAVMKSRFSDGEIREIRESFKRGEACRHCGGLHSIPDSACRRLLRLREEGTHVEAVYRLDVITPDTIFPWDLPPLGAENAA